MNGRWEATIEGQPCSKANSRRFVLIAGKPRFVKSKPAIQYSRDFETQLSFLKPRKPIEGDVVVRIRIWYASRRPDLDESLILDLLQGAAYENDRQVKEKHIYHMGVDKLRPRCEILVERRDNNGQGEEDG